MSWPGNEDTTATGGDDQQVVRDDAARPATSAPAKPKLWKALAIDYAANSAVTGLATTAAVVAPSTLTILATVAGLVGTGVKTVTDRVKKDAEAKAVAERDAANRPPPAPRVTASGSGALAQANATIAAVQRAISEADQKGEQVYDALEASRERLVGRLGGGSQVPAELQETYSRNAAARTLLVEAHAALDEVAVALAEFKTTALDGS